MKFYLLKKLLFLFLIGEIALSGFFIFREIKQIEKMPEISWHRQKRRVIEKVLPFEPAKLGWEEATPDALWTKRDAHTAVVFQDKIWMMGGMKTNGYRTNDVWKLIKK